MQEVVAIKAENIQFGYGKNKVLHNLSFEVNKGDFLFLLGPNGSGKTTLFKCLLGIYPPDSGNVLINGENLHSMSARQLAQKIAYIPQAHNVSFNYTVLEVVTMGRTAYIKHTASPTKEDTRIAIDALEQLGISHLKDKGYAKISCGQRQLVLIARALAQQSRILIMDEPTSSLDYGHQAKVLSVVRKLSREGYTVIISSHNPEHVFMFATKVLVIKDGFLVAAGEPHSCLTKELLENIYDIPIDLMTLPRIRDGERQIRICVPDLQGYWDN